MESSNPKLTIFPAGLSGCFKQSGDKKGRIRKFWSNFNMQMQPAIGKNVPIETYPIETMVGASGGASGVADVL